MSNKLQFSTNEYVVYPDGLVLLYGVYPNAPVTLADVIALV